MDGKLIQGKELTQLLGDKLMKLKTNLFNILSIISFILYFITLFPIWFDANVQMISGTLVLTSLFPLSEICIATFLVCSVLSFVKCKTVYSWVAVIASILQSVLTIRLIIMWHGLTFMTVWFYVSFLCLVVSVALMIVDALKKNKSKSTK